MTQLAPYGMAVCATARMHTDMAERLRSRAGIFLGLGTGYLSIALGTGIPKICDTSGGSSALKSTHKLDLLKLPGFCKRGDPFAGTVFHGATEVHVFCYCYIPRRPCLK